MKCLNKTLQQDFGIDRPKIAVLGLNPHAGDQGAIGEEESTIIAPALSNCHKEKILAFFAPIQQMLSLLSNNSYNLMQY